MTVEEIMKKKSWVVAGDTLNPEKYASKIKEALLDAGYSVQCVGKEKVSLDECAPFEVLDLCIHPAKGLSLIEESTVPFDCVLIQPGAGSEEIEKLLEERNIPFVNGCALKGLGLR